MTAQHEHFLGHQIFYTDDGYTILKGAAPDEVDFNAPVVHAVHDAAKCDPFTNLQRARQWLRDRW